MKIALCAGHHPENQGAINERHNRSEYAEASVVVRILEQKLLVMGHAPKVITGRLSSKVETINAGGFGVAIDLHFNADADHLDPTDQDDSRGAGTMVMYCPAATVYGDPEPPSVRGDQADDFAYTMATYLGCKNLGGRPGWYWGSNPPTSKDYFLERTNCPAFIPEPGYIDNNGFTEKWLVAGRYDQLADAILAGMAAAGFI